MGTTIYPETICTAHAKEKSTTRASTIVVVAVVALLNLIGWLADWSRWVFFIPAVSISLALIVYYRVTQRRRSQVRDDVQARD